MIVLRSSAGSRAMARSAGTSSMCVFEETGRGIARHPEERLVADETERGRLARLHGDAVKQHFAPVAQRVQNQIALADGRSTREHEHIVFEAFVERALEIRESYPRRSDVSPATPPCSPTTAATVNRLMS